MCQAAAINLTSLVHIFLPSPLAEFMKVVQHHRTSCLCSRCSRCQRGVCCCPMIYCCSFLQLVRVAWESDGSGSAPPTYYRAGCAPFTLQLNSRTQTQNQNRRHRVSIGAPYGIYIPERFANQMKHRERAHSTLQTLHISTGLAPCRLVVEPASSFGLPFHETAQLCAVCPSHGNIELSRWRKI